MILLRADESDSPEYVDQVQAAIVGAAAHYGAHDVYVVKIDNWFGRRWLGFSHKLLGVAGVHRLKDFVLPGFVPARVVSETRFERSASGDYAKTDLGRRLHIEQMGSMNQYRCLRKEFPDAAFFWWAGRSEQNQKGALMCYYPQPDGHQGWYVGFSKNGTWHVSESVAISPKAFRIFQDAGVTSY